MTYYPDAVPLDGTLADAPVTPDLPETALKPFAVGEADFGENLFAYNINLVIPAGATTATLIVKGVRSYPIGGTYSDFRCFELDATGAPEGPQPPHVDQFNVGPHCTQAFLKDGRPAGGYLEVLNDASGALVLPSGVHWVPRSSSGTAVGGPVAIYADPAGAFRMLTYTEDWFFQTRASWDRYSVNGGSYSWVDPQLVGEWISPVLKRLGSGSNDAGDQPVRTLTLSAPSDPVEFALVSAENALFRSTLVGDTLSPPSLVSTIAGTPGVTSSERGHRLLLASPGGRIDRIVHDDAGELAREAIARVVPPPGERVVAAVDLEGIAADRLLVATWQPAADVQRNHGRIRFYTTVRQPPVRWPWAPAAGVRAKQHILDVAVCWPQTSEPLSKEGWTLGGAPALQVLETIPGRCALIVRDAEADPVLGQGSMTGLTLELRTRVYLTERRDWEAVARAHGEAFGELRPVSTFRRRRRARRSPSSGPAAPDLGGA